MSDKILPLPESVRSQLRSGITITSVSQCVEELVLNSLDAGATCVAVRVDLHIFRIQVIDNGHGIRHKDLKILGKRHATSKCRSVDDINRNLSHYGFRGEALASMVDVSAIIDITSRARSSTETYTKLFTYGKEKSVTSATAQRPSVGTTITIQDFMYNMPVRRKLIKDTIDIENIRMRLESFALIHPKVSFSFRNDCNNANILQASKSNCLMSTFMQLFGSERAQGLVEIHHALDQFSVSGYISTQAHMTKALQFIYVNKRVILKTKIHRLMNEFLAKSSIISNRLHPATPVPGKTPSSPPKGLKLHGIYVLNIECPYSEYDISLEPKKTLVEFRNWDKLLCCIEEMVLKFIQEENLVIKLDERFRRSGRDQCVEEEESPEPHSSQALLRVFSLKRAGDSEDLKRGPREKYGRTLCLEDNLSAVQSLPVSRKRKKEYKDQTVDEESRVHISNDVGRVSEDSSNEKDSAALANNNAINCIQRPLPVSDSKASNFSFSDVGLSDKDKNIMNNEKGKIQSTDLSMSTHEAPSQISLIRSIFAKGKNISKESGDDNISGSLRHNKLCSQGDSYRDSSTRMNIQSEKKFTENINTKHNVNESETKSSLQVIKQLYDAKVKKQCISKCHTPEEDVIGSPASPPPLKRRLSNENQSYYSKSKMPSLSPRRTSASESLSKSLSQEMQKHQKKMKALQNLQKFQFRKVVEEVKNDSSTDSKDDEVKSSDISTDVNSHTSTPVFCVESDSDTEKSKLAMKDKLPLQDNCSRMVKIPEKKSFNMDASGDNGREELFGTKPRYMECNLKRQCQSNLMPEIGLINNENLREFTELTSDKMAKKPEKCESVPATDMESSATCTEDHLSSQKQKNSVFDSSLCNDSFIFEPVLANIEMEESSAEVSRAENDRFSSDIVSSAFDSSIGKEKSLNPKLNKHLLESETQYNRDCGRAVDSRFLDSSNMNYQLPKGNAVRSACNKSECNCRNSARSVQLIERVHSAAYSETCATFVHKMKNIADCTSQFETESLLTEPLKEMTHTRHFEGSDFHAQHPTTSTFNMKNIENRVTRPQPFDKIPSLAQHLENVLHSLPFQNDLPGMQTFDNISSGAHSLGSIASYAVKSANVPCALPFQNDLPCTQPFESASCTQSFEIVPCIQAFESVPSTQLNENAVAELSENTVTCTQPFENTIPCTEPFETGSETCLGPCYVPDSSTSLHSSSANINQNKEFRLTERDVSVANTEALHASGNTLKDIVPISTSGSNRHACICNNESGSPDSVNRFDSSIFKVKNSLTLCADTRHVSSAVNSSSDVLNNCVSVITSDMEINLGVSNQAAFTEHNPVKRCVFSVDPVRKYESLEEPVASTNYLKSGDCPQYRDTKQGSKSKYSKPAECLHDKNINQDTEITHSTLSDCLQYRHVNQCNEGNHSESGECSHYRDAKQSVGGLEHSCQEKRRVCHSVVEDFDHTALDSKPVSLNFPAETEDKVLSSVKNNVEPKSLEDLNIHVETISNIYTNVVSRSNCSKEVRDKINMLVENTNTYNTNDKNNLNILKVTKCQSVTVQESPLLSESLAADQSVMGQESSPSVLSIHKAPPSLNEKVLANQSVLGQESPHSLPSLHLSQLAPSGYSQWVQNSKEPSTAHLTGTPFLGSLSPLNSDLNEDSKVVSHSNQTTPQSIEGITETQEDYGNVAENIEDIQKLNMNNVAPLVNSISSVNVNQRKAVTSSVLNIGTLPSVSFNEGNNMECNALGSDSLSVNSNFQLQKTNEFTKKLNANVHSKKDGCDESELKNCEDKLNIQCPVLSSIDDKNNKTEDNGCSRTSNCNIIAGWKESVDNHGKTIYVNLRTGNTSYSPPHTAVAPEWTSSQPLGAPLHRVPLTHEPGYIPYGKDHERQDFTLSHDFSDFKSWKQSSDSENKYIYVNEVKRNSSSSETVNASMKSESKHTGDGTHGNLQSTNDHKTCLLASDIRSSDLVNSEEALLNGNVSNIDGENLGIEDPFQSSLSEDTLNALFKDFEADNISVKWLTKISPEEQKDENSAECMDVAQICQTWKAPSFPMDADVLQSDPQISVEGTSTSGVMGVTKSGAVRVYNVVRPYKFTREMLLSCKVHGQLDNKFIACTISYACLDDPHSKAELVVLFDQHAIHERIRLETLIEDNYEMSESGKRVVKCSVVTPPLAMNLPDSEVRLMTSFSDLFFERGLHFTKITSSKVSFHAIPNCLVAKEANEVRHRRCQTAAAIVESIVRDMCHTLHETGGVVGALPKPILHVLNSQACRGAIKFGDELTIPQCEELIASLSSCQLPFQCAHGRPSIVPVVNLTHLSTINKMDDKPNYKKFLAVMHSFGSE